jgi:hypothetical protein
LEVCNWVVEALEIDGEIMVLTVLSPEGPVSFFPLSGCAHNTGLGLFISKAEITEVSIPGAGWENFQVPRCG